MTFNQDLWQRLEAYQIGPPDAALSFCDRLARENRWSRDHAAQVILEYKRFCYLACTTGFHVTPSDAVDQAWHLHLTYSRDYWETFCPDILGKALHHGPTQGGSVERTRYYDQYAGTLKAYEDAFGQAPPADIWPNARERFLVAPKAFRVNPDSVIVLSRTTAWLTLSALVLGATALGWVLGALT